MLRIKILWLILLSKRISILQVCLLVRRQVPSFDLIWVRIDSSSLAPSAMRLSKLLALGLECFILTVIHALILCDLYLIVLSVLIILLFPYVVNLLLLLLLQHTSVLGNTGTCSFELLGCLIQSLQRLVDLVDRHLRWVSYILFHNLDLIKQLTRALTFLGRLFHRHVMCWC